MGGEGWSEAIYLSFVDTPRLISWGYELVNLGCAPLANGVRSPADPERDPGMILCRCSSETCDWFGLLERHRRKDRNCLECGAKAEPVTV